MRRPASARRNLSKRAPPLDTSTSWMWSSSSGEEKKDCASETDHSSSSALRSSRATRGSVSIVDYSARPTTGSSPRNRLARNRGSSSSPKGRPRKPDSEKDDESRSTSSTSSSSSDNKGRLVMEAIHLVTERAPTHQVTALKKLNLGKSTNGRSTKHVANFKYLSGSKPQSPRCVALKFSGQSQRF